MIFNAFRDTSDSLLNSFEISPLATMNVKKNSIIFSVLASFKVFFIKLDPSILITFTNNRNMKIWILGYTFYKIVILCSKREHCMFLFTDRFTCIDVDMQVLGVMQVSYIAWTWLIEGRPRATITALFLFTCRGVLGYCTQLPLSKVPIYISIYQLFF